MKHAFNPRLVQPALLPSPLQIVSAGGGQGTDQLLWAVMNATAAVIAYDVLTEAERLKDILRLLPNSRVVTPTEYDTANSIFAKAYPDDLQVLEKVGNCLAQRGMGQRGGLGAIGVSSQLEGLDGDEILRWLRSQCIKFENGVLSSLRIADFGSSAGGLHSQSQIVVGEQFVRLGELLGIPVELDFHSTDSITFAGLGEQIHANSAASIKSLIEFACKVNRTNRSKAVVNVRVATLPPMGSDNASRRDLALLDKQAWYSSQFQQQWVMIGPNHALASPIGNILHTSTEYFRPIPKQQVASHIAAGYFEDFGASLKRIRAMPHLIIHFDTRPVSKDKVRPSIDSLVERYDQFELDGFLEGVKSPKSYVDFTLTAEDIQGRVFDCERLPDHFTESPSTLSEASSDLIVITTIHDLLLIEESENNAGIAKAESKIRRIEKRVSRSFDKLRRARFGRNGILKRLCNYSEQLRNCTDERRERRMLGTELEKSIQVSANLRARKLAQLVEIQDILDQFRAKGKQSEGEGRFYYKMVDEAFPNLLLLPSLNNDLKQFILTSQAKAVTEEGIQYILGASSCDVNALAEKCIGEAPLPGAWLAGIKRKPHHKFIVLPPMSAAMADSLKDAIKRRASDFEVIFSDSCALGINTVRINLFFPRNQEELMPGFLRSELERIENSDLRLLHVLPSKLTQQVPVDEAPRQGDTQ